MRACGGVILAAVLAAATTGGYAQTATTQPTSGGGQSVPKFGLFEVGLTTAEKFVNPFWDAAVTAEFTSPAGKKIAVEGFYYGGQDWRVRFVPREEGQWQYRATLKGSGPAIEKQETFQCIAAKGPHGFLRQSAKNPFRMEYEDGTPYYPIGEQTGGAFQTGMDGPEAGNPWRTVPIDEWLKTFSGALNLLRTQLGAGSRGNSGLPLIPAPPRPASQPGLPRPPGPTTFPADIPLDRYDTDLAAKIDGLFAAQRQAGFSIDLILFDDMSLWGSGALTAFGNTHDLKGYKNVAAANLPLQEKYLRYVVARFGCYVDIWELFNEDSFAPNDYLAHLAKVIRQADPYGHILTTNYPRPGEKWCEIVTFHEYMGMPANEVDAYLNQQFALYKAYGKPVQNTEFGNQGQLSNYDPVKWRIAVWTAYMNECGLLFWDMSGIRTKGGNKQAKGNANAYLGPETRRHFRVLNEFTRDMPVDMRPAPIGYHEQTDIRTYALSNGAVTAVYVHHFADHGREFQLPYKLMVMTGPGKWRIRWIDPEDGKEVKTEELSTPQHYLEFRVPPVKIDLAARLDRIGE